MRYFLLILLLTSMVVAQHTAPAGKKKQERANRLVHEKSPYLQQHAYNPVDWWPWGEEAFAEAKKRGVPVFLSVGYSTCHWCHVMEHESFENEKIAKFLNDNFINIKVDREERPDVDRVYMEYIQLVSGNGGWPASIWMTAEKKPFYAGTYFPPEDARGRIGFLNVCKRLIELWKEDRADIERRANKAVEILTERAATKMAEKLPRPLLVDHAVKQIAATHDKVHGGWGRPPKFPRTSVHDLMFQAASATDDEEIDAAAAAALHSLTKMARGGIYDHVGGGIHRYSVDAVWLVPHFEKMLYDQALVAASYLEAGVYARDPAYFEICEDILACVLRDFLHEGGAFFGSYDADSGGHEGTYYVWSVDELEKLVDEKTLAVLMSRFDLKADGNWHETPGRNILAVKNGWEAVAKETKLTVEKARALWEAARPALRAHRDRRPRPGLDDKIITEWNGMMIATFARAGRILGKPEYVATARKAAGFILKRLRTDEGFLLRRWCKGEARFDAVLGDYAWMMRAALDLFEATGDPSWVATARELADLTHRRCADTKHGGWFDAPLTAKDVLVRTKEPYDGAIPSGNSVAIHAHQKLAALTGEAKYRDRAESALKTFQDRLERFAQGYPYMVASLPVTLGTREIVIVGDPAWKSTKALHAAVNATPLAGAVLCLVTDAQVKAAAEKIPLLKGRASAGEMAVAYVCRNGVCKAPVTTAAELEKLLHED